MTRSTNQGRSLSLQTRLMIGVGIVVVLQVAVGFAVVGAIESELVDQIDDRLTFVASTGDETQGPSSDNERGRQDQAPPARPADIYAGVLTADGSIETTGAAIREGQELADPVLDIERASSANGQPISVSTTDGSSAFRLVASQVDNGSFALTGLPLDGVNETMSRLKIVIAFAMGLIALAIALVAWLMTRLGIGPIKRMTARAEAIAAGDLSERIGETSNGTEAGQLGQALNSMLARIETAFDERAAAEQRLRQFLADASHELRTPVTTIRGYAELYHVGGLDDPDDLDDAMRRTGQESQRMSRLIADLLALAKLDEGRAMIMSPVDLAWLGRDAVIDARAAYPGREILDEIPPGPVMVQGDEDRLRQVLSNLMTNALVHTGSATVRVRGHVDDTTAHFEFSDDGPGMAPDVVAKVTERFYRADASRSRHTGGSGLGLAIVDGELEAHGGTLSIESAPGMGTSVRISLPLVTLGELTESSRRTLG